MGLIDIDGFCREKCCANYLSIEKLKSRSEIDEIGLRNLRIYCERACPYRAHHSDQQTKESFPKSSI